jgi:hypothetical protein
MALLSLALSAAFFYSSVELHFANPNDAVWIFGMMGVGGATAGFLAAHNVTLKRISESAVNQVSNS